VRCWWMGLVVAALVAAGCGPAAPESALGLSESSSSENIAEQAEQSLPSVSSDVDVEIDQAPAGDADSGPSSQEAEIETMATPTDELSGFGADRVVNGCNLSKRPVRCPGANLSGVDLRDDILFRADLRNTSLYRANLAGVSLMFANLEGADLQEANLRGATIGSSTKLISARLAFADLTNALISGGDFRNANLENAKLTGVPTPTFWEGLTSGASWPFNFSGTVFTGATGLLVDGRPCQEGSVGICKP